MGVSLRPAPGRRRRGPSVAPAGPPTRPGRARWLPAFACLLAMPSADAVASAAALAGAEPAAPAAPVARARGSQEGGSEEVLIRRAWLVMGTELQVAVAPRCRGAGVCADEIAAAVADVRAAYEAVVAVDRLASLYREDSGLARLNRAAGSGPVRVESELFDLLGQAQRFTRLSDGAFDVTVAPLVRLWGFDRLEELRVPSPAAVRAARERVGADRVRLLPDGRVELAAGSEIDLGAIAKGWAVDRALETLQARGVQAALVNLGGNVGVLGTPPGRAAWEVAVRHPRAGRAALGVLLLRGRAAAATSGDYERFFEAAGARYGHVIDPRTGWPVRGVVAATVVAPSATAADALSTATMVLGASAGLELIGRCTGAEGLTVTLQADGGRTGGTIGAAPGDQPTLRVRTTAGLRWRPAPQAGTSVEVAGRSAAGPGLQPCAVAAGPRR